MSEGGMSEGVIGLFDGIRVLEIGQYVAAPIAAELFAHGGADVIKLEPVAGDVTRFTDPIGEGEGRQYVVKARGKRALPLDLSSEAGRQIALDLAARSDVLITNLRPGTATRLGLDYESLGKLNPGLVYGEINGFGDTGPNAHRPSLDLIAQSWTGLRMASVAEDGSPGHYEAFHCDYVAGLLLAFGVSAALRHREITGQGQRVSTSLAHAGLYVQHRFANLFETDDGWKREMAERRAEGESLSALAVERVQRSSPELFFMTTYETSDGAVSIGAAGALSQRICELFDVVDPRTTEAWRDRPARVHLMQATRDAIARRAREKTTAEVMAMMDSVGVPAGPVRLLEEVLVDPEAHEAGLLQSDTHPRLGTYTMPAAPISLSGSEYRARNEFAAFGEHTDQLLEELGYDQATVDRLVADGIVRRADVDAS